MTFKKSPFNYETSTHSRARWNVLDLLEHISRKSASAHLRCEVDTELAQTLCKKLSNNGTKVTITAVLLKAIAIAQLSCPESRSYKVPWGGIITCPVPVAGFTVERLVEGDPAVFFGFIENAHTKPLTAIASELTAYGQNDVYSVTQLAKETFLSKVPWILRQFYILIGLNVPLLRRLISPATFGLTSLGKFGAGGLIAPNVTSSIFGIGSIEDRPVASEGQIMVKKMMSIYLSADIRVFNIYQAARLLNEIKTLIESGFAGHLIGDDEIAGLPTAGLFATT